MSYRWLRPHIVGCWARVAWMAQTKRTLFDVAYALGSWAVSFLALAMVSGLNLGATLNCGTFHTCQVPPCSVPAGALPWGVPASALPFSFAQGAQFHIQQRLKASTANPDPNAGPDQQLMEWNWEQRSNLRAQYALEGSAGVRRPPRARQSVVHGICASLRVVHLRVRCVWCARLPHTPLLPSLAPMPRSCCARVEQAVTS